MQMTIIGVTFFSGVGLAIVAVVALFMKLGRGKGSLKLLGIELSGTGAPILFLFVGGALMLSGFGWASSREEVAAKTQEVAEKEQEKVAVVREASELDASLSKQVELNRELITRVPPAALQNLRVARPDLVDVRVYQPSPILRGEISRIAR